MVNRHLKQVISIDHALLQLRIGAAGEVADRLPDVIATLLPLLELLESVCIAGSLSSSSNNTTRGGYQAVTI